MVNMTFDLTRSVLIAARSGSSNLILTRVDCAGVKFLSHTPRWIKHATS